MALNRYPYPPLLCHVEVEGASEWTSELDTKYPVLRGAITLRLKVIP